MKIKYTEIENAFEFVSFGSPYEHEALLDRDTGKIYMRSEYMDNEGFDEFPEDCGDSKYVEIPHKHDLGLGSRLVFKFVGLYLSDQYDEVERIFSKRGAYRNFKLFLSNRGILEKWYDFENSAVKEALLSWCKLEKIEVVE